jgi:hypothetical protein
MNQPPVTDAYSLFGKTRESRWAKGRKDYTEAMSSSDDRPNSSENAKRIKTFVIDTNEFMT